MQDLTLNTAINNDLIHQNAIKAYADGEYSNALKLAISLIDDNYKHAYTLAGMIYEKGGGDVIRNIDNALFYYNKAIEEIGAVEAYLALGRMYYFGKGVTRDFDKAFDYYSTVDKDIDNPVAWIMLGQMYQNGYGTKKNINKAKDYYIRAAKRGYIFGLTFLGLLEQECGRPIKGWYYRLKAGWLAYLIALNDPHDSRLRNC
jgi:TPR repeat protein